MYSKSSLNIILNIIIPLSLLTLAFYLMLLLLCPFFICSELGSIQLLIDVLLLYFIRFIIIILVLLLFIIRLNIFLLV